MARDPDSKVLHPTHKGSGPTDIDDPLMRREARKAFVWIGIASLVVLTVFLAQPLLVIFGGMVFAALIDGGSRLLGRVLRIGRGWRVAIILLLTALFLVWTAMFAGTQITSQAAALPSIVESQWLKGLAWLENQGFRIEADDIQSMVQQGMGGIGTLTSAVGGIIGAFTTLFLIIVLGIYFAVEPRLYRRGVAWMLPVDRRDHFRETVETMGMAMRRLLFGRLLGMVVEGVATWFLLELWGVPMAALLGLITGLLAFLPNIGAPVSGALMVLVGFSGGVDMGLYTIFVYLFVQTVDGYVIVPMIARKTVDLAPALVLGAQLIMGVLFGILGLALADPLVAMIKVWLERSAARNGGDQAADRDGDGS
ncbi:MAG: AI-2E family transporter [Novosphingobium sp.]|nr:AI-2E family transporter [Novosphingobium sp.]